uniref:Acetyltransferase n=1 Tax=Pristionchus pacificus TaxID=54126 RepID=A0A8R1YFV0_PRIPA
MLSRGLRQIGGTVVRCLASSSRDPSLKYEFIPAAAKDKGPIMDVALNHFLYTEPHSVALGITRDSGKDLIDWIVSKSLHYPYCYTIKHRESGKIIGFRLMSVAHKDSTKDFDPFDLDIGKCEEGIQILVSILDSMKKEIWKYRPEASKILRREITFVHKDHQRQGIAQYLLHLGLDFEKLRAEGYDGLQSEASSKANQTLLAKNGYKLLAESTRKSYTRKDGQPINFPDETKCVQLCYLNLRKSREFLEAGEKIRSTIDPCEIDSMLSRVFRRVAREMGRGGRRVSSFFSVDASAKVSPTATRRNKGDIGNDNEYASPPYRCPTDKYDFLPAGARDKGTIMDIALNDFIYTEPHSVALRMTRENGKAIIDWIVSKSLHHPYCYTIRHRESGKTVGFRLMSVAHRDSTKNFDPFELDIAKCTEGIQILAGINDGMKQEIWRLLPEVEKILRREVTFVNSAHQRQGIAQHLLHHGLDFQQLKAEGFAGLQSEASSRANQHLLAKNGYKLLMETTTRKSYTWKDGQPIDFPDETKCMQLYFLSLRDYGSRKN